MRNLLIFAKKELTENIRTKNLLALMIAFAIFAILNPVLVRYMDEIFQMLMPEEDLLTMLPPPYYIDAYVSFFANMGQVGAITVILVYMGCVLREKRSGTSDLLFTKSLRPATFVLAKFIVAAAVILAVVWFAALLCFFITDAIFEGGGGFADVFAASMVLWLFLIFMLAVVVLFSSLFKRTSLCAVLGLVVYFVLAIVVNIPRVGRFTPGRLFTLPTQITAGVYSADFWAAAAIALAATGACIWAAVWATAKRQIS